MDESSSTTRLSGWRLRLRGLAVLAAAGAAIALAASLEPARRGHGTHRSMGLPQCELLMRTGWPCPSCGMTTSMAAMARLRVAEAFHAQPFGVVLFAALLAAAAAGATELAGRNVWAREHPRWWWGAIALVLMLAGWGYKALAGYWAGTFPLR